MAAFSFSDSPFAILSVSPRSSVADIEDAFEDAVVDNPAAEPALLRVKAELLTPNRRLIRELSWPLELAPNRAQALIAAIAAGDIAVIEGALDDLPLLSRINIAAVAAERFAARGFAQLVLRDYPILVPAAVAEDVNAVRSAAGFARVSADQVAEALDELRPRFAQALLTAFQAGADNGKGLADVLTSGDAHNPLLLELVTQYAVATAPRSALIRRAIAEGLSQVSAGTPVAQTGLLTAIDDWGQVMAPVMMSAARRGLDDRESVDLCADIRAAYFAMGVDSARFDDIRTLVTKTRDVFRILPGAAEQLDKDLQGADDLIAERLMTRIVAPLIDALDGLRGQAGLILSDTGLWAVADPAPPLVVAFRETFARSLADLAGGPYSGAPYRLVRDCALKLNNEDENSRASRGLLQGLLALPGAREAMPEDVRGAIEDDFAMFASNHIYPLLTRALDVNHVDEALQLTEKLLTMTTDNTPRLEALKASLIARKRHRRNNLIFWGVMAALGVIGAAVANFTQNGAPPAAATAPETPDGVEVASSAMADVAEAPPYPADALVYGGGGDGSAAAWSKPPIKPGAWQNLGQLTYCAYELVRITDVYNATTNDSSDVVTDHYNRIQTDYNARCQGAGYVNSDLDEATAAADRARPALAAEAAKLIARWKSDGH